MGIVIFKVVISKSVPRQKFWRKRNHSAQGKPEGSIKTSWKSPGKKYQVAFDSVFVVRFLAQSVAATLVVPDRKQPQVIRKWVFVHVIKAAVEGRKGRAGCTQKALGHGSQGGAPVWDSEAGDVSTQGNDTGTVGTKVRGWNQLADKRAA